MQTSGQALGMVSPVSIIITRWAWRFHWLDLDGFDIVAKALQRKFVFAFMHQISGWKSRDERIVASLLLREPQKNLSFFGRRSETRDDIYALMYKSEIGVWVSEFERMKNENAGFGDKDISNTEPNDEPAPEVDSDI